MFLLESLFALLAPDHCVSCSKEGSILCGECYEMSCKKPMAQCYVCKQSSPGWLTCSGCKNKTPLSAVWSAAIYKDSAKEAVSVVKYRPSRSGASRLGSLLSKQLPYFDPVCTVITHAPTTAGRVRERGFDQAAYIAKVCAKSSAVPYVGCLTRVSPLHQVGTSRKERKAHMLNGFDCLSPEKVKGKDVLIIDDVLTTGATLESAARALKRGGANRVFAATFARTI